MLTRHQVEAARARMYKVEAMLNRRGLPPTGEAAALDALEEAMDSVRLFIIENRAVATISIVRLSRLFAAYDADAEGMQRR